MILGLQYDLQSAHDPAVEAAVAVALALVVALVAKVLAATGCQSEALLSWVRLLFGIAHTPRCTCLWSCGWLLQLCQRGYEACVNNA